MSESELRKRHPNALGEKSQSVRHDVTFSERRFDTRTLPEDMQRVYSILRRDYGEEYALVWVFSMRTAVELHRAWHNTLLTAKILQQIKDRFGLRMTWNIGVTKLIFRIDDGRYELHRKVPYDYDSEFQDLYYRVAVALVEGRIDIHQALLFQAETWQGLHTARSGLFLRDFPGRLILYPILAASCCVIFFGGDWRDFGVAALCGLVSGILEWAIRTIGGEFPILNDIIVGTVTGIIGGLFWEFQDQTYCLSSIFLGTLYWYFYGTAFVIGILEILAGELETGVTRFIAVSIKTFVLTLGACFGLYLSVQNPMEVWFEQRQYCGQLDLHEAWWRIPVYLLSSAGALGQYRFPIVNYWRGLAVQLAGYEVQYQVFFYINSTDYLDTAVSNVSGAAAAVVAACALTFVVDNVFDYYNAELLQRPLRRNRIPRLVGCLFKLVASLVICMDVLRIGRKSDALFLGLQKKLKAQREELQNPSHPRSEIVLSQEEERLLVEAIITAEDTNVWSVLMPTLYQLVPGSIIAALWFDIVFPPPIVAENVFSNLMVISTCLALGLLVGFVLVQTFVRIVKFFYELMCQHKDEIDESFTERMERKEFRGNAMFVVPSDDPEAPHDNDLALDNLSLTRNDSSEQSNADGIGCDSVDISV